MFSQFPFEPSARRSNLDPRDQARRLARGEVVSHPPQRGASRADLPDVDVKRVTYLPRRSFLQGLATLLGLRSVIVAPHVSGTTGGSSGETHPVAYLDATSTELHPVPREPASRLAA